MHLRNWYQYSSDRNGTNLSERASVLKVKLYPIRTTKCYFRWYPALLSPCKGATLLGRCLLSPLWSCLMLSSDACCGCHFLGRVSVSAFSFTLPNCSHACLGHMSVKSFLCEVYHSYHFSSGSYLVTCTQMFGQYVWWILGLRELSPRLPAWFLTSSCTYKCETATCLIFPTPIFREPWSAAELSHQILGVSTRSPKSSSQRFLRNTVSLAHWVKERISASPLLVAGTPGWVCDETLNCCPC